MSFLRCVQEDRNPMKILFRIEEIQEKMLILSEMDVNVESGVANMARTLCVLCYTATHREMFEAVGTYYTPDPNTINDAPYLLHVDQK